MPDTIYKLTAEPGSGVRITDVAEACYQLSKQLGIPVEFIHNDTRYTVELVYTPKQPKQ